MIRELSLNEMELASGGGNPLPALAGYGVRAAAGAAVGYLAHSLGYAVGHHGNHGHGPSGTSQAVAAVGGAVAGPSVLTAASAFAGGFVEGAIEQNREINEGTRWHSGSLGGGGSGRTIRTGTVTILDHN